MTCKIGAPEVCQPSRAGLRLAPGRSTVLQIAEPGLALDWWGCCGMDQFPLSTSIQYIAVCGGKAGRLRGTSVTSLPLPRFRPVWGATPYTGVPQCTHLVCYLVKCFLEDPSNDLGKTATGVYAGESTRSTTCLASGCLLNQPTILWVLVELGQGLNAFSMKGWWEACQMEARGAFRPAGV